ncbi:MAG TPA: histidine kinase dimerization/phospho-acceptor domain-containing protein, partial [Verrucomicrobiae bacterium]|nr:histidine kinase dimerization/phospho-acceptor domain-containing protein [Verrucomicrobiae bacterium]
RDQLNGMSGRDLVAAEEQEKYLALVRALIKGVPPSEGRITFLRSDGSRFIGEVSISLVDLGDEKVAQAVIRDVTPQVRREEELRRRNNELSALNAVMTRATSELRLESALEVTLDQAVSSLGARGGAIHLLDRGRVTEALQKAGPGLPPMRTQAPVRELPCTTLSTLTVNRGCSGSGCPLAAGVAGKSLTAIPLVAKGRGVGVMHLMYDAAPDAEQDVAETSFFQTLGNQIGMAIEHSALFRQIDDRNKELLRSCRLLERSSRSLAVSENRLKENLEVVELANQELERLDKMKTQFLGMVSHEFRTPLTTIMSGTEFLLAQVEGFPEEQRTILEMVRRGGERLHEIVADLLKVAQLEAKQVPVNRKPVDLGELLGSVVEEVAVFLEQRRQTIVVEDTSRIPYFQADRHYLKEVLLELVGNAMKFTPDGGRITVVSRVASRTDLEPRRKVLKRFHDSFYDRMGERLFLQMEIRDTGIGIGSDEQVRIFDKFYEVGEISHHSSGDYKFQGKGAGLGLAIARG